jgi:hypothetical protein
MGKSTMRAIAITTINPPTDAIRNFSAKSGWQTIVAGDRKTPADWQCRDVIYLSPEAQAERFPSLCERLPIDHYCRKLTAYLYAIQAGAECIFDTDDDNIPKQDWLVLPFDGTYDATDGNLGWINVYRSFTEQRIWPRGFPLQLLSDPAAVLAVDATKEAAARVGIWQSLADGDPDVDAIYRLIDHRPCYFQKRAPIALAAGTMCPFNSQATAFRREMFPLLYLPATVTFRFTDILRGIVAQPIMWAAGYLLGFTQATVVQDRNQHDLLHDFRDEIPCYLRTVEAMHTARAVVSSARSLADNLVIVYERLTDVGIVKPEELSLLDAWLTALQRAEA